MPNTDANAYERIRTHTNAYQIQIQTHSQIQTQTQKQISKAKADAHTNASAFANSNTTANTGRNRPVTGAVCVDAPVPTVDKYTPFHKGFPLFPQNYPHPGQTLSTCRIF